MQARSIECRAQRLLFGWPPPTRSGFCGVVAVGGTEEGGGAVAAEEGRCDGGGGEGGGAVAAEEGWCEGGG